MTTTAITPELLASSQFRATEDASWLKKVLDMSAFDHYDQIVALSQGMINNAMATIDTYDDNPLDPPEKRQYNKEMREWLQKHFQVPGDYRPERIFAKFADAHWSQVSLVTNPFNKDDLKSVYEQWKNSSEKNASIGNAFEKVFQVIAVQRQNQGLTTIGTRFNLDAPPGVCLLSKPPSPWSIKATHTDLVHDQADISVVLDAALVTPVAVDLGSKKLSSRLVKVYLKISSSTPGTPVAIQPGGTIQVDIQSVTAPARSNPPQIQAAESWCDSKAQTLPGQAPFRVLVPIALD
ncbi:hypothetical protein CH63R_09583 [Colletotrichum higginsianum IMI 349063]|uniref:Uncharacterized protein n=1 Tax=Colletotrichum higginsianum (strain IMI 349063) TaxID=759273 RepID=A0A1B7Y7M4_COLHI|nr:hypothetical protein CH63R_09583 [Colletotrichum higginsianum IMI 349063]OBR08062.1 hypothetical protein CH63R_09583 [Colletotrichum higginsianum IMI 349063]